MFKDIPIVMWIAAAYTPPEQQTPQMQEAMLGARY